MILVEIVQLKDVKIGERCQNLRAKPMRVFGQVFARISQPNLLGDNLIGFNQRFARYYYFVFVAS